MPTSSQLRWTGVAAMLGGLLFVAFGVIFAIFTHGSTATDRKGTLFGLNGTDYCRLAVAWPVLLMVGLAGFDTLQAGRTGRLGRVGRVTALGALATVALSLVLQCWGSAPEADSLSAPVIGGFLLGLVAYPLVMAGLIVYGAASMRANALPRWRALPLILGLLGLPPLWVGVFMPGISPGGPLWDVAYAASRVPWGLGWVLLGYALWRGTAERALTVATE